MMINCIGQVINGQQTAAGNNYDVAAFGFFSRLSLSFFNFIVVAESSDDRG